MTRAELLVVGSGPAGVAAALHGALQGLDVVLTGDEPAGGLARAARRIDNLPGLPAIAGERLAQRLQRQLERADVCVVPGRVRSLGWRDGAFVAELADRGLQARCAVVATGTRPRALEVQGWDPCRERGRAHRDVRSLPDTLDGARVLVVGGGEVAVDTALSCVDRGGRVALALRGQRPRARSSLLAEARQAGVELWPQVQLRGCEASAQELVVTLHGEGAPRLQVAVSHVVACIGREPDLELVRGLGLDAREACEVSTRVPGLYLAGDLIRASQRYIAVAQGDGVRAACLAQQLLRSHHAEEGPP